MIPKSFAAAANTLRVVCGLNTAEIAHAFLLNEPALAQRLVRAKRKIAEAGVPFEIPGPKLWADRLDAVLSTVEVAYSKAHEDAAATGPHASYAAEMLNLTQLLAELLPEEGDVLAFAALGRHAEAGPPFPGRFPQARPARQLPSRAAAARVLQMPRRRQARG